MRVDVKMPKLGESLTEGTVLKWYKKIGESVKKDETLLEVATDKVDSEIPSPADGVLVEIIAQEQETVEVDSLLARLETDVAIEEIEDISEAAEKSKGKEILPTTESKIPLKVEKEKVSRFYSPLVKSIARQEGISLDDLEKIEGSGSGGRVTKNDLLNYVESNKITLISAEKKKVGIEKGDPTVGDEEIEIIPMDNIRKKIAMHMRESLDTSAHVYSVSECDMTHVMNLMYAHREEFLRKEGFKLTVTPFFLYATIKAILDYPRINSSLEGDNILQRRNVNLGIAVAVAKGLIVPVIKSAEKKQLHELARILNDLVVRARDGKLTLNDIEGSTFSITNYGIFGNIFGLPIINQPNVAILGIGAIKKRLVVIEGESGDSIGIRSMCYISMSYDHRLIDGELGGKFMQRVVEYLETMKEDVFT